MVEGFLFDGVDTKPAAAPVGGQHHVPANVFPHKTFPALIRLQPAVAWAESAHDAPWTVWKRFPVTTGMEAFFFHIFILSLFGGAYKGNSPRRRPFDR